MTQSSMKVTEDREFLGSSRWKCEQSPSGAHHWIVHSYNQTCRYCNLTKQDNAFRPGYPINAVK